MKLAHLCEGDVRDFGFDYTGELPTQGEPLFPSLPHAKKCRIRRRCRQSRWHREAVRPKTAMRKWSMLKRKQQQKKNKQVSKSRRTGINNMHPVHRVKHARTETSTIFSSTWTNMPQSYLSQHTSTLPFLSVRQLFTMIDPRCGHRLLPFACRLRVLRPENVFPRQSCALLTLIVQ